MKKILLGLILAGGTAFAQDTILPLWPKDQIPNFKESSEKEEYKESGGIYRFAKVQEPTIEVYLPSGANANGKAMLIFPGGGYGILAYDWEGTDIAKWLNSMGIAGIVVKYRLPSDASQTQKQNVPLIDAQRAMRLARNRSKDWNIEANKIGIIGFSAGGHLASTLGTHFDEKVYMPVDAADKESARPDFMVLGYPVITMDISTHGGSKQNLLGKNPSQEMVDHFSNEKQVTAQTPPTFLFHATDDGGVPVENSILFYEALKAQGVPAAMHLFPNGGHGFSLALKHPHLRVWTDLLYGWTETLD